jgi:hypothetical protein
MENTMPSKSASQARLMAAAAHTPGGFGGVPQSVGQEFNQADKGTGIRRQPQSDSLGNVDAKLPTRTPSPVKMPFGKFGWGGGKKHKAPKLRIGSKTYG